MLCIVRERPPNAAEHGSVESARRTEATFIILVSEQPTAAISRSPRSAFLRSALRVDGAFIALRVAAPLLAPSAAPR